MHRCMGGRVGGARLALDAQRVVEWKETGIGEGYKE